MSLVVVPSAEVTPESQPPREPNYFQELVNQEPVISAAILLATAFRMRNEGAVKGAIRTLTNAVAEFERVSGVSESASTEPVRTKYDEWVLV